MKKFPLALNLGWAGLVVAAFFAGSTAERRSSIQGGVSSRQPVSGVSSAIPSTQPTARSLAAKSGGKINTAALVRPMTFDQIATCLRIGLSSGDLIEGDLVFTQAIAQMTRENAPDMMRVLSEVKGQDDDSRLSRQRRFLLAWGRLDGPAAVAFETKRRESGTWPHEYVADEAIKGWVETDPEAALAYIDSSGLTDKTREKYLFSAIETLADTDLQRAIALNANMEPSQMRRNATRAIADVLKSDQAALFAWVDQTLEAPDRAPSHQKEVLSVMFNIVSDGRTIAEWMGRNPDAPVDSMDVYLAYRDWARSEPRSALESVLSASEPGRVGLQGVMESWAKRDAASAAAWARANMNTPRIKDSLPAVIGALAETDLRTATDWVRELEPGLMTTDLAKAITEEWVQEAPEDARLWIDSLPSGDVRDQALRAALQDWPQDRLEEFDAWLGSSSIAPGDADNLLFRLSDRFAATDPRRAIEVANGIKNEAYWLQAVTRAAVKLAQSEPGVVREWLPDSGLPASAQRAVRARTGL